MQPRGAKRRNSPGAGQLLPGEVKHPQRVEQPAYQAECEDIIQALNLDFNEGCIFKAIWRFGRCPYGQSKPDHKMLYDAERLCIMLSAI